MEDSIHHKQLRQALVDSLYVKGINDPTVLDAINKVPRHLFIGEHVPASEAYEDKPIEIGKGQTISQPYTVAYQTALLDSEKGDKILEIGTGSGYQSAVLYELGADLYTIERQKKLYSEAKLRLAEMGYSQIKMFYGDGNEGLVNYAPFDKIIVTAAAPGIPATLVDELKIGGIMVIPVDGQIQKMLKVTKTSATETRIEEFDDFRFVPLLSGVARD
jgi:protein-L-isoaspartate(D-aspartate) O-methyltransferase